MIRKNFYIKEKSIKEKSSIRYIPSAFIAVILIAFGMSGFTANVANYILIGILFSWYLFAFILDPSNFFRMCTNKITLAFTAFIIFFFLTCLYSSGLINTIKFSGEILIFFSYYFVYLYYYQLENKKYLMLLFKAAVICWAFFTVVALVFYQLNENAARLLASDHTTFDNIAIGGGYNLAYGSAILCVYLFDCLINKRIKKAKYKFSALISCILLFLLVYETRSTITIIIISLGIFMCLAFFVLNKISKNMDVVVKSIVSTILIGLTVILFVSNLNFIGESIVKASAGKRDIISIRMFELGNSIIGQSLNSGEGDMNRRFFLIEQSFDTFLESPLIGVGYKYGYIPASGELNGVGNHSEWSDALAKYGLFGAVPFFLVFIFAFFDLRKRNKSYISSSFVIVVILLGFLNPFKTSQSIIALFFILNAAEYYFSIKKGELNNGQVIED